jgi:fructosamine-3-kinase
MLTLFGTPPAELFDTYAEHAPLDPGWRERAPLYNLYHLLNHLNLFGGGYGDGVRRMLARFG